MSAFSVLGPPLLITSVFAILPSRSHILKKQSRKGRRSSRHTRFEEFASIEVNGKCYMTPKDFLDEVTFSYPRPRIKRKVFSEEQVYEMLKDTPHIEQAQFSLRQIGTNGLISYKEYIFLLALITKPANYSKTKYVILYVNK